MKIVYLNANYTRSGGTEKILCQKANYLIEKGYDVSIITLLKATNQPFFSYDKRIHIYELNMDSENTNKQNIALFINKLDEALLEIKPDISIATDMRLGKYLYRASDSSKKILESHFSKFKRKNKLSWLNSFSIGHLIVNLFVYKQTQIIKKFDQYVVLTYEDREQWRNLKQAVTVIPNVVEYQEPINIDYSSKQIIGVGRLSGQKAWDHLIDIWSKLAKKYPEWQVKVYGDGEKKNELNKLIKAHKIEDSFTINPATPDIIQKYKESSIFVMTSRYEGLPMVLIEAMSLGLPTVTYKYKCGPKDYITDQQTGYLIDLFNKNMFAEVLAKLMDNEEIRCKVGKAAQRDITPKLNKDRIMNEWISLFDKLIGK